MVAAEVLEVESRHSICGLDKGMENHLTLMSLRRSSSATCCLLEGEMRTRQIHDVAVRDYRVVVGID